MLAYLCLLICNGKGKDVLVSSLNIYVKNEIRFSLCIDFQRLKWASHNFSL